jgi:uncharacterized protein
MGAAGDSRFATWTWRECVRACRTGTSREFARNGRGGAKLFHEDDPFAQHRQLDDTAYSFDHFHTKILGLPNRMNTAPGRELARARMHVIEQFLKCLLTQIGCAKSGRVR